MEIVVFGEDGFTGIVIDSLIEKGHNIKLVITPYYETSIYLNLERVSKKHSIPLLRVKDVNSEEIIRLLIQNQPELIISVHLRKVLKKEVFSIAKKGAINVHPSLLPKYRGMSPQHQALIHGDNEAGVTVHFIDEDVDTGKIIIQEHFSIAEDDYIVDVQLKVMDVYKTIVAKALELIKNGYQGHEQDTTNVSYFGPIKKNDREIHLDKSSKEIYNLIRALSMPYKGAFYGEYTIWSSLFPNTDEERNLKNEYPTPGLYTKDDILIIRLKNDVLISDEFNHL
jgi:methionyl-tRNA formyltransferase